MVLLGADVADLLRAARERARLSQRELARRARTSKGRVQSYERGATSPSTAVLDRLVEACGLQLRVTLEPRVDPVDVLAGRVVAGAPEVRASDLVSVAERFGGAGVPWAADGATALALLGIAVPHDVTSVVLEDGPELRGVLTRFMARGYDVDRQRSYVDGWYGLSTAELDGYLPAGLWVLVAPLDVRVVEALPSTVSSVVDTDDGPVTVPVVPQTEVESAHPWLAELMDAVRGYRGRHG